MDEIGDLASNVDNITKECRRCKKILSIKEFSKDKSKSDGHMIYCKTCSKEKFRKYYNNNKEKCSYRGKIYYLNNKSKIDERHKKYNEENKDKLKKYFVEYKENHKVEIKVKNERYRKNNKEKIEKWFKEYFSKEENRLRKNEVNRICYNNNKRYYIEKAYARKKKLKNILLFDNPFPEEVEIEYHHINNLFIIPLPATLHRKTSSLRDVHRNECNDIIMSLFYIDVQELLKE